MSLKPERCSTQQRPSLLSFTESSLTQLLSLTVQLRLSFFVLKQTMNDCNLQTSQDHQPGSGEHQEPDRAAAGGPQLQTAGPKGGGDGGGSKVLQGFWLPPSNTSLNKPSQQLSKMAAEVTKAVEDWVSAALSPVLL